MKHEYLRVPYGQTVHGEEEIAAVVETLRTSTQMGPKVRSFEEKIAKLYDKPHGIMVNSGSSALLLAMRVLKLPKGSEVITPVLTFSTTVAVLLQNDLIPVFVDVEPGTYNIDTEKIAEKITNRTRAMLIPNLIGNFPDWDKIKSLAKEKNIILIEDSADTLGSVLRGSSTGTRCDISTTSFYGSHVINCAGNGGMLCVREEAHANLAKLLRSWGRDSSLFVESEKIENRFDVEVDGIPYDKKFVFSEIGYNLEPSEVGASFGLVQLSKLNENINLREKWFKSHNAFFSKHSEWFILPKQMEDSRTPWLAFPLTLKETAPFKRRELQIFLEKRGIQTRTIFTGNILRQPGFKDIPCVGKANDFPIADQVMRGGMLLGCHQGLSQEMVDHMHDCFSDFAQRFL